ncbi:MAG TPA: phosphatase PAP2 family protein [Solirubrobacteraceae bacterium]|jgi:undecaprenyl-diphosphatase|nr:phosphatase PAP2 family protein [Solirubrobacteraceae bacterium]
MTQRSARLPLLVGGACVAGMVLTAALALHDPGAQARDALTLQGFNSLSYSRLGWLAHLIVHAVDPVPYAVMGGGLAWICVGRDRPRVALAVAVVMVASVLTSDILKPLLAEQRNAGLPGHFQLGAASWPSGHATGAMALALSAVLAAPRRWRPLAAALGTALAVGVGYSLLMLVWHFPSDVLGGYLVAALWMALAIAGLRWADARWPALTGRQAVGRAGGMLAPLAMAGLAGTAMLALVVAQPHEAATFAEAHKSFVVGALVIAGVAWSLATGLVVALRR